MLARLSAIACVLCACGWACAQSTSSAPASQPASEPASAPASASSAPAPTAEELAKKAKEKAEKLDEMRFKLQVAELRQQSTQLDQEGDKLDEQARTERLMVERKEAAEALDRWLTVDMPRRLEGEKLGLKYSEDRLQDAEEELRQLEMMYAEDDLADKTKEIVLNRAKRGVERSKESLDMERRDLKRVESVELPQKTDELRRALEDKTREQERHVRSLQKAAISRQISNMEAERDLAKQKRELAEAEKATD